MQHIHIKDFDGHSFTANGTRRYLHPGEGPINFKHFFDGLKQYEYDGYVSLESAAIDDNGVVSVKRLQKSLRLLKNFMD